MRVVRVAGVQLTGPPDNIPSVKAILDFKWNENELSLSGVKAMNWALANGDEKQRQTAKKLLEDLDVEALKSHYLGRITHFITRASEEKCDVVVFPELCLTGFFPLFYIEDKNLLDRFFERDGTHSGAVKSVLLEAEKKKISIYFGYAEINEKNEHFNVSLLYDFPTKNIHIYKKTHLPGFKHLEKDKPSFQFEYGQFKSSTEGYPVFDALGGKVGMTICHDRRYSAPYLCMGFRKVELILNGYNSAAGLNYASAEGLKEAKGQYDLHYLPQQGQAITEGTYIVSVAMAGNYFGSEQIAGSCIIDPYGKILIKSEELKEELLIKDLDLDISKQVRQLKHNGERSEPDVLVAEMNRILGFPRVFKTITKDIQIEELVKSLKDSLDDSEIKKLIEQLQK